MALAPPINPNDGWLQINPANRFAATTGGRTIPHTGVDIASHNARHVPVYAIEAGQVIYTREPYQGSGPGGNVRFTGANGTWLYGHMSRVDARPGQRVKAGQRLGLMGATGAANGVHLHITLFTSAQAALANAVPSALGSSTISQWAARNSLKDPTALVAEALSTAQAIEEEIMGYYKNREEMEQRIARAVIQYEVLTGLGDKDKDGKPKREVFGVNVRRGHKVSRQVRTLARSIASEQQKINARLDAIEKSITRLLDGK